MSKIARYQGNVRAFASDAQGLERTVFGGTNQADDLTSQITASFLRGWGIVGASEHPSLEDFNAAMYAMSQFIAYQHQMGVPEWHSEQEYHIGSMCTYNGESYQSLQNANVGSQPPSAKWTPVLTSKNGLSNLGFGSFPQYQTLGDGQHIFQHGTGGSNSSGIADIVFPKAFTTTNNLNVTATATSQQPANYIVTVGSVTTTGVRLYLTGANAGSTPVAAAIGFHWKAEGR